MTRKIPGGLGVVILILQILTVAILLVGWEHLGSSKAGQMFISTPGAVASQFVRWFTDANRWSDIAITAREAAGGFLIGTTLSILLAIVLGISPTVSRFASPFVAALNGIPKIALGPLFILLFGLGIWSKVYFVATVVFFIPFYNIFMSLRAIEPTYLHNAKILGASPRWLVVDIYAPALFGVLIASLRLTASWAMLSASVGELLASSAGVGHVIKQGQHLLQNDIVLSGIILISSIVFIVDRLLVFVERRYAQWTLA